MSTSASKIKCKKREVEDGIYTTAAKTNAGGNAQANIKIMPNCNANSK